ncbi:hypothetical protein V7S43_004888 [Phytophthora oleae]|uniref:Uncharacterized protein n=1 Tax=Phytophthora oleae TaxID=2107226 RepID=A0ABD3FW89_9STRA
MSAVWGDVLALTYPKNKWLDATDVAEKTVVAKPLLEFTSVATSKVPFASSVGSAIASKINGKRRPFAQV